MKEVLWTETAKKPLQENSDFILERWNSDINDDFVEQLEYRINQLQKNPELGSTFQNTQIRKLVIHKTVSLFYTNTTKYIKLLVIWDNRQDSDQLLDKLSDANHPLSPPH
ncbi:MAG: type II toxin-antitoxin system RelE/ParE family toxin [Cyclobacteriaceae bacterium]